MKGVEKRCGCRSTDGKRLLSACPLIDRTGHGTWMYRLDLGPGLDGNGVFQARRQETRSGFPRKKDAEQARAEHLSRLGQGQQQARSGRTVGAYLQEWLEAKVDLRANTRRCYESNLRLYLLPHLGHVRLQDLDAGHVERMYAALRGENTRKREAGQFAFGPTTMRRIHSTLLSALNTAVRKRYLPYNPAKHVELETAERPQVEPWTVQELGIFLDATAADRLGVLYELMAFTGLRRGEAVGLRWCDVDLDRGVVHVRQAIIDVGGRSCIDRPKTKRSHGQVDLDAHTIGSLLGRGLRHEAERRRGDRQDWRRLFLDEPDRIGFPGGRLLSDCTRPDCSHELVFSNEDGTALRPEFVTRHMQDLAAAAGLPRKRLHDLRHGAASLQIAAGVDIAIISKRLRHSSLSITADTYTHLLEGVGRQAAEAARAVVRGLRGLRQRASRVDVRPMCIQCVTTGPRTTLVLLPEGRKAR